MLRIEGVSSGERSPGQRRGGPHRGAARRTMSIHNAVDFEAFWEAGGPWPPLALSALVGVVTLVVGLMLVYHGTSMSSSPLILCSVAGLLIGLALTVILPQARGALSLCFHGPQLPRTHTASTHPLTAATH